MTEIEWILNWEIKLWIWRPYPELRRIVKEITKYVPSEMKDGHQSTNTQNNRIQQKREKSWDKINIWRHVENKFKNFEDFRLKVPKSAKEDNFLKIHTHTHYSEILECKDKILTPGKKSRCHTKEKESDWCQIFQ